MNALTTVKKNIGKNKTILSFIFCFLGLIVLMPQSAKAQTAEPPPPSTAPLELSLLEQEAALARRNILTANTIAQEGLTNPSLWWAREQFAGKLVDNWLAYPNERRVDVIVNRQLWTILDYIERYSFLNQFGTAASDFGYSVRIFNPQKALLAAYTCNFNAAPANCRIWLDAGGTDSLRIRSRNGLTGF